ncbi:DUF3604 domain-containing protein [Pontibacter sp. G13]|uniref:DUF3604 domain-containing protein n=1 Tax=Pontibacter sp. G13 TaxID=3074898 RepID=UPI002889D4DF|nr:DUF3604 domain-containing protein [Pontibacter sp. G13]WNJ19048.1 DUF3604 domain-containing protein [Pontibacter sp. G13]
MNRLICCLIFLSLLGCQKDSSPKSSSSDSPSRTESATPSGYPTEVYFGDTHLHTEYSMDAGAFGNTLGLDEAYQFAKGQEVTSSTGLKAKLSRPLDFLVIADHSDGMGVYQALEKGDDWVMGTNQGKRWNKLIQDGDGPTAAVELIKAFSQGEMEFDVNQQELQESVWAEMVNAAETYNEPGTFTAFIGYEWTSLIKGNNLHRVVIYRDGKAEAIQKIPANTNANDTPDPEYLWNYLTEYEQLTGGKALAIPHNGNLSNGMMFTETRVNGQPFDESYVKERIKWEPLYEITQIKGDGESHPFLSPNDEFADFENWDVGNLDLSALKTNDMLAGEYGRSALKLGLKIKNDVGTNPYKFGLIGSTDAHTSLATADDNNFYGKAVNVEGGKDRWEHVFIGSDQAEILTWETVASGYAAVWAHENTRASLFDAMMRKETYATTGPRMKVRFFGGYDFAAGDLEGDWVKNGYEKGVPMGGDLAKSDKAPNFIVQASMDPEGGSLDRIQIVKGWANPDGTLSEKVYEVVWAGDRQADANGAIPRLESTVNEADATWDNSSGASELKQVWQDPDFDPALEAFYYVRVLEIPTPRWTLYDKIRMGSELSDEVPLITQQRAYTSPIWYSPK